MSAVAFTKNDSDQVSTCLTNRGMKVPLRNSCQLLSKAISHKQKVTSVEFLKHA